MLAEKPRLYAMVEQEITGELYKAIFSTNNMVNLMGVSLIGEHKNIQNVVSKYNPDIVLTSVKRPEQTMIEELRQFRLNNPRIGIVFLMATYNAEDIKLLKKLTTRAEAGMAIFSKISIERSAQLVRIIMSVNEGQIVLDPAFTDYMFADTQSPTFFKDFTNREMEILSLIAKGYTNTAIANELYIDVKTVHNHINSIYSKVKADADFEFKHPRVSIARLYLETIGELALSRA